MWSPILWKWDTSSCLDNSLLHMASESNWLLLLIVASDSSVYNILIIAEQEATAALRLYMWAESSCR